MAKIRKGSYVKFHYELRDQQGKLIESTFGGEPLDYVHGEGQIIEGLEAYLEGEVPGFEGRVTVLSRGYGNCRISSTATPGVWWVQYFNSQDRNILNTIEITDVPEVACAAQEDLEDSATRLAEILEIYR